MKTAPVDVAAALDAQGFFNELARLMKDNPPEAADGPMVAKLASIGVVPGQPFDIGKQGSDVAKAIADGVEDGKKRVLELGRNPGNMRSANGWIITTGDMGSYGTNYDGTKIGIGTHAPGYEQPVYYWDPSIAPSGLVVYSGAMFPEWRGDFLVGALKFELVSRLHRDQSGKIVHEERMFKRVVQRSSPDAGLLRQAARAVESHLDYLEYLLDHRRWLAGQTFSLADIAAASHLSIADYLGGVDWAGHNQAKQWYSAIKSRPSVRPMLAERMEALAPPPHYDKLDF